MPKMASWQFGSLAVENKHLPILGMTHRRLMTRVNHLACLTLYYLLCIITSESVGCHVFKNSKITPKLVRLEQS